MTHAWVLLGLIGLLLGLGVAESLRHRRNLGRIPIRIHVNGTRGKSSVTRLIAAGLRAGGIPTCAKTSGTEAAMILPNGFEYAVYRPASPNVIEQVRIVGLAASSGARALVVECMALQPVLQWLSESRLVRATHGVITNVRPDHLDVMGPDADDVARALAGSVPVGGTLFTAERRHRPVLEEACRDRDTALQPLPEGAADAVSDDELSRFSYVEHKENVALALQVCEELGVDRKAALEGMWSARPDPGAMTTEELDFFGRRIVFVNGFAANDPESTGQVWQMALDSFQDAERRIAVFNCRADRADRSRQLGEACVDWPLADAYVLMGTGTYIFARAATRRGLDVTRLVLVENQPALDVFEAIVEHVGRSALVMGMGNTHGGGLELARLFRNRAIVKEA